MNLEPYQFEPIKKVDDTNEEKEMNEEEESLVRNWEELRVGQVEWCLCKNCKVESREIDCLCCEEVDAMPNEKISGFDCTTLKENFAKLCLEKIILKNVLTCLHETRGDFNEENPTNKSYRFAAYKQYI